MSSISREQATSDTKVQHLEDSVHLWQGVTLVKPAVHQRYQARKPTLTQSDQTEQKRYLMAPLTIPISTRQIIRSWAPPQL